jgi:hypothetical protein
MSSSPTSPKKTFEFDKYGYSFNEDKIILDATILTLNDNSGKKNYYKIESTTPGEYTVTKDTTINGGSKNKTKFRKSKNNKRRKTRKI